MIVVVDTSPVNYLVLIGTADVLPRLYDRVIVPRMVLTELRRPATPAVVRTWISKPPAWLEELPDPPFDPALISLDPGERTALSLAEVLNADVLMDDMAGRRIAERRHIKVTGTLGVLAEAHRAGLLDFDVTAARLRATTFRVSDEVETAVRRRLYPQKKEP